jgi:hypothetical protein
MTETTAGIAKVLSTIRKLPVWLLAGLALAGYAILYLPSFANVNRSLFLAEYGVWIWVEAVTFSILSIARGIDAAIEVNRVRRDAAKAGRALRLVPLYRDCWWSLSKQADDSFVSQLRVDFEVLNLTDRPIRIVKASLVKPKTSNGVVYSDVALPMEGSPYYSSRNSVPPHDTATAHLSFMVRGRLGREGGRLRVTFAITDQLGEEYVLPRITLHPVPITSKTSAVNLSIFGRLREWFDSNRTISNAQRTPPLVWVRPETQAEIDIILNEEKRAYRNHGRAVGGLGSLNVGLQDDQNRRPATGSRQPSLLCDEAEAQPVESPNLTRLLKLWDLLSAADKKNVQEYLLGYLRTGSPYAEIAYFLFVTLHRMNMTVEALSSARSHLAGDNVYGYSNVLATLAVLVSREHFSFNPDLYPRIQKVLEGDTEPDFKLREKINSARLQRLDDTLH